MISTIASQNPINRTSDSASKQAIQNAILKSQTTTDDWHKWMKRLKTHQANQHNWHACCKQIARKTTNPYDYAQMPSWRQIGSDKAKKWHISGDLRQLSMHKEDYTRICPKMALSKGGFPKSRKNTRFLLFTDPISAYFLFGGQLYAKAPSTAKNA